MSKDSIQVRVSTIFNFFIGRGVNEESLVSFFKKFFFIAAKGFLKLKGGSIKVFFKYRRCLKLVLIFKVVSNVKSLACEMTLAKAIKLNSNIKVGDSVLLLVKKEDCLKILNSVETELILFFKKSLLNENFKKVTLKTNGLVQSRGSRIAVRGVIKRGGRFKILLNKSFFSSSLVRIKQFYKNVVLVKVLLQENLKTSNFIILVGGIKKLWKSPVFRSKHKVYTQVFNWDVNILCMLKTVLARYTSVHKVFLDVKRNLFFLKLGEGFNKSLEKTINNILNTKVTFNIS